MYGYLFFWLCAIAAYRITTAHPLHVCVYLGTFTFALISTIYRQWQRRGPDPEQQTTPQGPNPQLFSGSSHHTYYAPSDDFTYGFQRYDVQQTVVWPLGASASDGFLSDGFPQFFGGSSGGPEENTYSSGYQQQAYDHHQQNHAEPLGQQPDTFNLYASWNAAIAQALKPTNLGKLTSCPPPRPITNCDLCPAETNLRVKIFSSQAMCQHELEALLKGSGQFSRTWLLKDRVKWHPDQFGKYCHGSWREKGKMEAQKLFQLYRQILDRVE